MVMNLRVERQATLPGPVAWAPIADHRVKLHAGSPVRGTCRTRDYRQHRHAGFHGTEVIVGRET